MPTNKLTEKQRPYTRHTVIRQRWRPPSDFAEHLGASASAASAVPQAPSPHRPTPFAMLASKRPRRAASAEDSLDPRVMTERQQLAFLLRATAPSDASGSSSDSDSSSSSDDDEPPRPRRPVKRSKTRATRASGTTGKTSPRTGDAPVIYCGRGRPPKNSIKLPKNSPLHPHARAARMSPRSHNTRSGDAAVAAAVAASLKAKKMAAGRMLKTQRKEPVKQEKTSPSSASDVAMLGSTAAAPLCALCCDLEPFCDAPLFLCPACDQKYPTQQALGRVCMT